MIKNMTNRILDITAIENRLKAQHNYCESMIFGAFREIDIYAMWSHLSNVIQYDNIYNNLVSLYNIASSFGNL